MPVLNAGRYLTAFNGADLLLLELSRWQKWVERSWSQRSIGDPIVRLPMAADAITVRLSGSTRNNGGLLRIAACMVGGHSPMLCFMRWYRVVFETDRKSKRVTAKLPGLNSTADYGATAEEALTNLRDLAQGFLEVLRDADEALPPSDRTEAGGVYLSLPEPAPRRRRARAS